MSDKNICPKCGAEMHGKVKRVSGCVYHLVGNVSCMTRQRDQWRERALAANSLVGLLVAALDGIVDGHHDDCPDETTDCERCKGILNLLSIVEARR